MSKQFRSPQEKKDLSYEKDRRLATDYPPTAPKNWPKKKVHTNRSYRHRVDQLLHLVEAGVADDDLQNLPADAIPVRRPQIRKWSPVTLRSAIKGSLRSRVRARLNSFSRVTYNSAAHKEVFTNFLNTEIKSRTAYSRELAFFIELMLNPRKTILNAAREGRNYSLSNMTITWLQAYFRDTAGADMESTLRDWIKDITSTKEILL